MTTTAKLFKNGRSQAVRLPASSGSRGTASEFVGPGARAAGAIRGELEAAEKPIGAYDVLFAGQARRRGATLVTSNTREFGLGIWYGWGTARARIGPAEHFAALGRGQFMNPHLAS